MRRFVEFVTYPVYAVVIVHASGEVARTYVEGAVAFYDRDGAVSLKHAVMIECLEEFGFSTPFLYGGRVGNAFGLSDFLKFLKEKEYVVEPDGVDFQHIQVVVGRQGVGVVGTYNRRGLGVFHHPFVGTSGIVAGMLPRYWLAIIDILVLTPVRLHRNSDTLVAGVKKAESLRVIVHGVVD